MKKTMIIALCLMMTLLSLYISAATISDYMILQDIDLYKFMAKGGGGQGAGILSPIGHFNKDHLDNSYSCIYFHDRNEIAVEVQVTQHAEGDSDKWLLHELDIEFRNYYGIPGYYTKLISGNTVYVYGAGGRDYRWLSDNKVIMIEYHDSQLTKPEPIEVIQAYLTKHPSSLPAITTKYVMNNTNKTQWIKDEMERRLWLCDKWFGQMGAGTTDQKTILQQQVKSMKIFLDYREKYFGIKAIDEKNALANYLSQNNGSGIKAKLDEYKAWWSAHKGDSISL